MRIKTSTWLAAAATALALASIPAEAAKAGRMSAPAPSCVSATQASVTIQVCGGATGAPAGFSLHWMTAAGYAASGGTFPSDDPGLCRGSFSGNANASRYDLAPGECIDVNVGDLLFDNGASADCLGALACGTDYVVRAFAHATSTLNRSDFTAVLSCSTLACGNGGGCTNPADHWRNFNPPACVTNPGSILCIEWPVAGLTLGSVSYDVEQLVAILKTPAAGNGLVELAHQVIAAKLNIASGADGSAAEATIAAADDLVGALIVPPVGVDSLDPGTTAAYTAALASYNEGAIGPGVCGEPDPGGDH